MIEEPLPLSLAREVQYFIHSPMRPRARGQVEFNIMLVAVQPLIEQKRF
jgi:hypothetical protein